MGHKSVLVAFRRLETRRTAHSKCEGHSQRGSLRGTEMMTKSKVSGLFVCLCLGWFVHRLRSSPHKIFAEIAVS